MCQDVAHLIYELSLIGVDQVEVTELLEGGVRIRHGSTRVNACSHVVMSSIIVGSAFRCLCEYDLV